MSRIPRIRSRILFASAVGMLATVVNATNADAETYTNANANANAGVDNRGNRVAGIRDTALDWFKDSGIRIGGLG